MSEPDSPEIIKAAEALVDLRRDDFGDVLPWDLLEPMEREYFLAQARVVAVIVRRASPTPPTEGREAIRREALEEAARVADAEVEDWHNKNGNPARRIATAIRSLSPPSRDGKEQATRAEDGPTAPTDRL